MLASMLKDMFCEAKIGGHKTKHSLHATGASELFEARVPEKIIKERTGHRSLEVLRLYERTTSNQHQAVSKVLSGQRKTTFQEAVRQQSVDHPTSTYTNCLPQPKLKLSHSKYLITVQLITICVNLHQRLLQRLRQPHHQQQQLHLCTWKPTSLSNGLCRLQL